MAWALAGCALKPATAVAPTPAADFPVKPDEGVSHPPGWAAAQVTASARYVRISGAIPEAKGALLFLTDEAALRAGTLTLTKAQADAALVELARITKREPMSTLAVTVTSGNAARMTGCVSQTVNGKEEPTVLIRGIPMTRQNDEDIELAVAPNVSAAGLIRMEVGIQATSCDGFIEYGDKLVTIAPGGEGGIPPPTTVRMPKGFYQPVFSTRSVRADVQMDSDAVIVLCANRARSDAPEGLVDGAGQAIKSIPPETMLFFLTAKILPTKRAD